MEEISVAEIWEIKYRESGEERVKLFDWWAWELAQRFVNEVDLLSIVFYATGLTEPVNGRAHDIGRLCEETLTKEDIARVSMKWIEERRKRLKEKYVAQG
jgi:hypothetical protein